MSTKKNPPKLAKKDLLALYDITHPTLRAWLRQVGLGEFVGRRRFVAEEVVLIFQQLGRPRLARTAAQRLKEVYARFYGLLPDGIAFREKYGKEVPQMRQDQLDALDEEQDYPQIYDLEDKEEGDFMHIQDALKRLSFTAIFLRGRKAEEKRRKAQPTRRLEIRLFKQRKSLSKQKYRCRA